ncbi:aminotransferase class V-fold PLP-dependent enzyme [Nocardioides ganghwensis]|jgi:aromatic-L-amino-acid decarboxylase|uniref:Aminotransferase class V-fold PLP-dependent enzyme n=2 Tax=Nocardioides ganghwensis TaxID=252230 RepID=A0A4Q2SEB2_9ACTN|nr:aminotransferase class V-fold PLP-dependent enzyme [Nocardioides ganghwensis]RYC03081.1 aminotransferase class V-fold PLP-dependent enzyme [Nocardioides ganghwensis]
MSPEEFRRQGHAAIDWIADYWASLDDLPVRAQVAPGDVRRQLPASAPEAGEPFDAVLADLDRVVVPGLTHWQHPRFFAYFPANSSPAAILGDLLSSGIGAQGMIWATSPAVTEVEQVVLDWFAEALGLPEDFRSDGPGGGVIQDTASTATFTALLAALHRASGGEVRRHGLGDAGWRVYGSTQAHSSLVKAAIMAGLGEDAVRAIGVDPLTQAMDLDALRAAIEADVELGLTPVLVHLAAGSTSTGAMDDVVGAGRIAREHGAWVHVDAAWAGVAAVCPEHRAHLAGVESADSFVTNPHKWLLTTFDCSTFWVRDRAALTGALSILPEYLRNAASESGEVVDYRDWHPQLGRRFRAIKLWAVLRTYGLEGLRAHIRSGVELAAHVADLVAADDRFEMVTEPSLSLVVFRLTAGDEQTLAAMEEVNASGEAYLSHTTVEGRAAIRLAVGSWRTTEADVDRTWRALQEAAAAQD